MSAGRKWEAAEFTLYQDNEPLSLDPFDCVAWKRSRADDQKGDYVTHIYTSDGTYWEVKEGYVEVCQVIAQTKANNYLLLKGL